MTDFGTVLTKLWPNGDKRIPGLRAGMIANAAEAFATHDISSPLLIAHVMAQISHECGAGNDVVENLSYTAARMMEVWPTRFRTLAAARPFERNPRALANQVYNGRMGNAPGSDDGWTYRGRGASQTTGKEGYQRLARATGLDVVANPDLVIDPRYFLLCGVADFVNCGCLPFAKQDDIVGVTRRLNGGTIGLAQRRDWLAKWKAALGNEPVTFARGQSPAVTKPAPASAPKSAPDPTPQATAPKVAAAASPDPQAPAKAGFWASLISALTKKG